MHPKPFAIILATAAVVPVSVFAAAGCGGGSSTVSSTTPPRTADGRAATVGVEDNGNLGKILADGRGRTVYLFQRDTSTKSTCAGECAAQWPPLRDASRVLAGTGTTASKLGTTPRTDGARQITYNGHPVYLFIGDRDPGDTNGQGINAFGARWFAVNPAGDQVSGTGSGNGLGY
jgi:predicted lipoprotein with Yx(FWY)xxD motif